MKRVNFRVLTCLLGLMMLVTTGSIYAEHNGKVRVLLIGDSTTEGGKPDFEKNIENMLNATPGIPTVEVINVGKGGETAFKLLDSGRYDREVAGVEGVDYIFVRYGINDWFQRKPLEENFPKDMRKVIGRLKVDYPHAQIIIMTIIPFLDEKESARVNKLNVEVAKAEHLEVFDIYPSYYQGLQQFGIHTMNVRFYPLSDIPQEYRSCVAPYTSYSDWKKADYVTVNSPVLDPLLGDLPGWYDNPHPNPMGYNLIARETVKYLMPLLKKRK